MESFLRVQLKSVSKEFGTRFQVEHKGAGALGRVLSICKHTNRKKMTVLDNISLNLKRGEVLGIIGDNSSGKTTLLRIISGIYQKDSGEIKTDGKILSLIGWGMGLKQRLTVKENIYLFGSLFGLTQKKIRQRFHSIIEFAELDNFIDSKFLSMYGKSDANSGPFFIFNENFASKLDVSH